MQLCGVVVIFVVDGTYLQNEGLNKKKTNNVPVFNDTKHIFQ